MRIQVYTVIYDRAGNFIVAKKNAIGYFFHSEGGKIFSKGKRLNGGGKFCFPGGELEMHDPVAGALQELLEETNVALNPAVFTPTPPAYYAEVDKDWAYYGVYFQAPADKSLHQLNDVVAGINENLGFGSQAASEIIKQALKSYDEMRAKYPYGPQDNELESCEIVNIKDIGKYFKEDDKATGWFYDIVQQIEKHL